MKIEDQIIRGLDSRKTQESSEIFRRAKNLIEKSRFKLNDFKDSHHEKMITEDTATVQEIEHEREINGHIETEHDRIATIFEALFHQHVEVSNWLGEGVVSYKTSKFDDYINHVDSVLGVEIKDRGLTARSYVALGIDVTTSEHFLDKKFERIFNEIRRKTTTEVRYFATNPEDGPQFKGRLLNLLRLVVGADVDTVKALSELWLKGNNRELGNHPIQHQIIEELIMQCGAFRQYAIVVRNTEATKFYGSMLDFMQNIKKEKQVQVPDNNKRDRVLKQMEESLKRCEAGAMTKK
jgi:hypothetical protein